MKYVGLLLIALLVVHLECGGSCLAETLKAPDAASSSAESPCHENHEQPTDSSQPRRDVVLSCSQGPIIEAKGGATGKCMFDMAAILHPRSPVITLARTLRPEFILSNPPGIPITALTPVLRI